MAANYPRREKFKIIPFKYDEATADRCEEESRRSLIYLAKHKQPFKGSYDQDYRTYYDTALHGRHKQLHDNIIAVLRGLSLRAGPVEYYRISGMIEMLCMYLAKVWMVANKKVPLSEAAKALYERPVARRWRRVIWYLRVQRWRLAFDEVAFAPGQGGALLTAAHFQAYVAAQ